MSKNLDEFETEFFNLLKDKLKKNKWNAFPDKESTFFFKKRLPATLDNSFLTFSKSKANKTKLEILSDLRKMISKEGYEKSGLNSVLSSNLNDPLFVTAGIQLFSDVLRGNALLKPHKVYYEQPCIRTQLRDLVGEGSISSFVNMGLTKTFQDPLSLVDEIDFSLSFLSKIGVFAGDLVLHYKPRSSELKNSKFCPSKNVLKFLYGSMELGTAGFFMNETSNCISDLGFGLERVFWGIYKTKYFSETISSKPFCYSNDYGAIDGLRASTLMSMSDLRETDLDRMRQFKFYLNKLNHLSIGDVKEEVKNTYNYWSNFISPLNDLKSTLKFVEKHSNKQRNVHLLERLGVSKNSAYLSDRFYLSQDNFIDFLEKNNVVPYGLVREVLNG